MTRHDPLSSQPYHSWHNQFILIKLSTPSDRGLNYCVTYHPIWTLCKFFKPLKLQSNKLVNKLYIYRHFIDLDRGKGQIVADDSPADVVLMARWMLMTNARKRIFPPRAVYLRHKTISPGAATLAETCTPLTIGTIKS